MRCVWFLFMMVDRKIERGLNVLVLRSSKSQVEVEWDCLLAIYASLGWAGRMVARERIAQIRRELYKGKGVELDS